jgi:LemA protein
MSSAMLIRPNSLVNRLRILLMFSSCVVIQKIVLFVVSAFMLTGCGYNALQAGDEQAKAAWAEVLNQYQRRADLVPNLVNTVKGFAAQEKEVLTEVTAARSRVGTLQVTPELIENEELFANFQQAQGQLSSALSRLLAVSEKYPQLRSSTLFRDLQAQLEGTENRIAVARNRYIEAVQNYNIKVRSFPTNLTASLFGHEVMPTFATSDDEAISRPPAVDFSSPATTP